MAHAAQPVSLAHAHNSTRLRDSVRQATSQVQRRSRDVGGSLERPCLARGDCCPPGKGCNRAGPSSRDEAGVLQPLLHRTQERWCLTEERAQAVLNCLSSFRGRNVVPLKQFQRLLGHMASASAAAVTPLGLLHMRPLQHWLHSRVPRWAWRRGTLRVGISQQCRRSLSPWTDLAFLRAGVPLEQVSRHTVVTTDASSTGWGATCNGQAASGLWTGPRLLWHINCLELWAVHLALRQFRPLLLGKHVLVRGWGVYDHTACHSSPAISSSGVTRSSSHCVQFTSRGSSIVRPTRSHDSSRSPENGDSIPRRSG